MVQLAGALFAPHGVATTKGQLRSNGPRTTSTASLVESVVKSEPEASFGHAVSSTACVKSNTLNVWRDVPAPLT